MSAPTTSAIYAIKLVEESEKYGLRRSELLSESGIKLSEIVEHDSPLLFEKYIALVEVVLSKSEIPGDLGFLVGEHTNVLEHGLLGYTILHGVNVKECIERYIRFQSLPGSILEVTYFERDDYAGLSVEVRPAAIYCSAKVIEYLTQEWLASMRIWRDLIDIDEQFFSRINISETVGISESVLTEHLGGQLKVSSINTVSGNTEIFFSKRFLSMPLATATNANIDRVCQAQCEKTLKNLKRNRGWAMEVQRQLSHSPGEVLSMSAMADTFHVSPRTLRRRLEEEGITYQELVLEFRMSMSTQYLEERALTVGEISQLVGYKNPANFYRAFLLEFEMTPNEYRQFHWDREHD